MLEYPDKFTEIAFKTVFKQPLRKWWHPIFGFDLIAFDDKVIQPPNGTSMKDQIRKDYGQKGVNIIKKVAGLDE